MPEPEPPPQAQPGSLSQTPDALSQLLEIGLVSKAWGVRGEVLIELHSGDPAGYRQLQHVFIGGRPLVVERLRPHRPGAILKLKDVDTQEAADELRGKVIHIREEDAPPPREDTYYHFQVLGMRVRTSDGRDLGEVLQILELPANDVFVVQGPLGEVLIPAIGDVVKDVNVQERVITVDALPGLLGSATPEA